MVEIIRKKRDGISLTKDEIEKVISGLVSGEIPDYQMAAWLMAVYFQGMTDEETAILTDAILHSGTRINLSSIQGIIVDKHSTGGVGDKTTMILAPLIAAAGVPVAKMSGRGLGHTGGTIDKLESIAGFSVDLTVDEFISNIRSHGIAISGQNEHIVPADKKLYALRDVTATVHNHALITSSIMSKKLACGADAIVIDLKLGSGAFVATLEEARHLGQLMINTARRMHRKVRVIISNMDQPLGYNIGNALEVKEAVRTLQGKGPVDLMELCLSLGAHMLILAEKADSVDEAHSTLQELIDNGSAIEKFKEFVLSQKGDVHMIDQVDLLPKSAYAKEVLSSWTGYVQRIDTLEVGRASMMLGAGRATKESTLDMGAGIVLNKKVNDYVQQGELIATLYADDRSRLDRVSGIFNKTYNIGSSQVEEIPMIIEVME